MKNYLIGIFIALFCLTACKKDPPKPPTPDAYSNGVLVLNEGLFQQNNSSISWYSKGESKSFQQVFLTENERGLGDTANDFELYEINGKKYIIVAVDVSSQLEIIEAATLKSVAQIPVFDGTDAREPREIVVVGQVACVANFDGSVAIVDLVNNQITAYWEAGLNPDGIAHYGNDLFVVNSGGLNSPDYDSTLSVFDLETQSFKGNITTAINCSQVQITEEGQLYLLSRGNYSDVDPSLQRLDVTKEAIEVEQVFDLPISSFEIHNDWLYYHNTDLKAICRINLDGEDMPEAGAFIDVSEFETFYGIQIDPLTGDIYCFDARGYVNSAIVKCYSKEGNFKYEFTAALNPAKLIFLP